MQKIVDSDRCSDCPARKICNALIPKEQQKPDTGWDAEGCGALISEQSPKTDTPQPPLPCRSGGEWEQRYIATEEEIQIIEKILGYDSDAIRRIRSRPLGVVGARGAEGTRGGGVRRTWGRWTEWAKTPAYPDIGHRASFIMPPSAITRSNPTASTTSPVARAAISANDVCIRNAVRIPKTQ